MKNAFWCSSSWCKRLPEGNHKLCVFNAVQSVVCPLGIQYGLLENPRLVEHPFCSWICKQAMCDYQRVLPGIAISMILGRDLLSMFSMTERYTQEKNTMACKYNWSITTWSPILSDEIPNCWWWSMVESGASKGTSTFHCYAGLGDLPPEDYRCCNLENGRGGYNLWYEI